MVVSTDDLSKSYGDVDVITDLSVTIGSQNNLIGILGPNGVGKTTFIEIITGQISQDSGSVEVLGYTLPQDRQDLKSHIGVLPESESPSTHLTVAEFLTLYGLERGLSEQEASKRINEWANMFGFSPVLDVLCKDISQGQKQMVMITQAFIHQPDLVFIDEPLTNLDPTVQKIFIEKLHSYVEDGNTVVLTTHNTHFAVNTCSELHLFNSNSHTKITDVEDYTEDEIIELLTGDLNE